MSRDKNIDRLTEQEASDARTTPWEIFRAEKKHAISPLSDSFRPAAFSLSHLRSRTAFDDVSQITKD
jgi:hypothetical protein